MDFYGGSSVYDDATTAAVPETLVHNKSNAGRSASEAVDSDNQPENLLFATKYSLD